MSQFLYDVIFLCYRLTTLYQSKARVGRLGKRQKNRIIERAFFRRNRIQWRHGAHGLYTARSVTPGRLSGREASWRHTTLDEITWLQVMSQRVPRHVDRHSRCSFSRFKYRKKWSRGSWHLYEAKIIFSAI